MTNLQPIKTILFVHHGSGDGGAAISLFTLIDSLDRRLFNPVIVCDFRLTGVEQFFQPLNCSIVNARINPFTHSTITWKWYTFRGFYYLSKWFFYDYFCTKNDLLAIVYDINPSLIHLNGISLLLYSKCLSLNGQIVVQHIREPLHSGFFGIRKRLVRFFAAKYVSKIIAISKSNASNFSFLGDKVSVLYNPIKLQPPTNICKSFFRSQLNICDFDFVLFFPGGSAFLEKGIFVFLEALGKIKLSLAPRTICALIPGLNTFMNSTSYISSRFSQFFNRYDLHGNVFSVPFKKSVQDYYFVSDIVVAPFIKPHFSRAVIEAGAMFKPVIGSDFDVISEVLLDNFNGLLVRPADSDDLAAKITYLLDNPETCLELGRNGNLNSITYDPSSYGVNIMTLYQNLT